MDELRQELVKAGLLTAGMAYIGYEAAGLAGLAAALYLRRVEIQLIILALTDPEALREGFLLHVVEGATG
jgi:hypothetical protein